MNGILEHELRERPGEELAQSLEFLEPRRLCADWHALDRRQRQRQQLLEGRDADQAVDPRADEGDDARAHAAQDRVADEQQRQAEAELHEEVRRPGADHLVVDQHRRERRDERDRVDQHGHGEQLPDQRPEAQQHRLAERLVLGRRLELGRAFDDVGRAAKPAHVDLDRVVGIVRHDQRALAARLDDHERLVLRRHEEAGARRSSSSESLTLSGVVG